MLPYNTLSSRPVPGPYLLGDDVQGGQLYDFERGGLAIQDASQGIDLQTWVCWYDRENNIRVKPLSTAGNGQILITTTGVKRLSFAFDRNMQPAVAYQKAEGVYFYWYDTSIPGFVTTFYAGSRTPRLAHDDKLYFASSRSDVLLCYLRDAGLYMRLQRERYTVEYTLRTDLSKAARLVNMGMTEQRRVQFEMGEF